MARFAFVVFVLALLCTAAAAHAGMQALSLQKLKPDLAPLLAIGCVDNDQARGFVCPPEVLKRFGCADIRPGTNLGGLDLPVAACVLAQPGAGKKGAKEEAGVAATGCKLRRQLRYVVYTTKGFRVAKSRSELLGLVAPVDSAEKAASFVMALDPEVAATPPAARGPAVVKTRDRDWREASGRAEGEGFVVRLFERRDCGCSRHPVSAVDYQVSRSGQVTEAGRKLLEEEKEELCVD